MVGPVIVLAILVMVSIAATYNGVRAALTGLALVAVLVGSALAYRAWLTGIKIDPSGVTATGLRPGKAYSLSRDARRAQHRRYHAALVLIPQRVPGWKQLASNHYSTQSE
jgi:hypothetical protein